MKSPMKPKLVTWSRAFCRKRAMLLRRRSSAFPVGRTPDVNSARRWVASRGGGRVGGSTEMSGDVVLVTLPAAVAAPPPDPDDDNIPRDALSLSRDFSCFRHLARRFWNQTCVGKENKKININKINNDSDNFPI